MARIKDLESTKKIWIVSELFYPDETSTAYILTKIANRLASEYDVNVICGPSVYDKERKTNNLSVSLSEKIRVIRKEAKGNKNKLSSRFFHSILLSFKLFFTLRKQVQKEDTVFIVTNPPLLMVLIGLTKKRKKFNLTVLVHDVFPENIIPAGIIKSSKNIFYKLSKKIFDKSYSKADKLIVLGTDMQEVIEEKIKHQKNKPEIIIIQNWAEIQLIHPFPKADNDKITFLFAGNLGRVQGLRELLDIITQIKNPLVNFHFAGTGALKDELISKAKQLNLENISFQGAFSRAEQTNVLNQGDVGLVTLEEQMYGLGVPSKAYNIMASGKAILYIGNEKSEIARTIKEYGIGYVFSFENEKAIVDFFNQLNMNDVERIKQMGEKSRQVAEKYFSENIILDKFASAI